MLSIIILNYNGARWIRPCLESIRKQTIFDKIETIVADNDSQDGSHLVAQEILATWNNTEHQYGRMIPNGGNYGYCKGNNMGAIHATQPWLLFLNNDTVLEPDSMEKLLAEAERLHCSAATPLVQDYDTTNFQSLGARGFDIFGYPTCRTPFADSMSVLMPEGCSLLIRKDVFEKLGGFDEQFFMYADEMDLCWRVWITGGTCYGIPSAIIHHRGAAQVNSAGAGKVVELRTSDTKRYYANRNNLLLLLKNTTPLFLPIILLQTLWIIAEGLAGMCLTRRISFFKHTVWNIFRDVWRLRGHIVQSRTKIKQQRQHGDLWMLKKFFRLRLNRWDELRRIRKLGLPKVS